MTSRAGDEGRVVGSLCNGIREVADDVLDRSQRGQRMQQQDLFFALANEEEAAAAAPREVVGVLLAKEIMPPVECSKPFISYLDIRPHVTAL